MKGFEGIRVCEFNVINDRIHGKTEEEKEGRERGRRKGEEEGREGGREEGG